MTSAGNKSGPVADSTTLRVLLVTRRVSDEGETNEALSRGGFAVQSQIVQEVGSLRQALDQKSWDAVL